MAALNELVRISRWHLDEKRRKLGDLERFADRLREDLKALEDSIAREQQIAARDVSARHTYPAYLEAELQRRERLKKSIADVDQQVEEMRETVAEAFREVKKYEMAKSNQDQRIADQRRKAEEKQLDEMGTQMHQRKSNA